MKTVCRSPLILLMFALLVAAVIAGDAGAQPSEPPGPGPAPAREPSPILGDRPDAAPDDASPDAAAGDDAAADTDPRGGPSTLLGKPFESLAAGIAFRPPAGARESRRLGADEIVSYVNDKKKWNLKVSRVQFGEPLPLTNFEDAQEQAQPGLLELTVQEFKLDKPAAEMLREEVIALGDATAGVIAARYSLGVDTYLHQQALVRASDRSYFIFTFTTPAPRQGELAADAGVRDAVETFNAVLDSVRLLDQSQIKHDQDQRLFRTRAFFLSASETRLRNALRSEQWMRILRDGKDIGYMYIVEEVASDLPKKNKPRRPSSAEGVRIGIRTRTMPEAGMQVDAESWMWMSFDKRHEQWSSAAIFRRGQEETYASEFGAADKDTVAEARGQERYTLHVTHLSKSTTAQPVERELPVFYLPQALGHLLPRLLPRFEQKGYMFASYVADKREVMARYVDVGREAEVTLDGKQVRAIPIDDRIGLEGPVTTHYISPDGEYLGSANVETKLTVLPTDRQTIETMWKDADLSRPGEVEAK